MRGFDSDPAAVATYRKNVGRADLWDARSGYPDIAPAVILGGPPCRPWSAVNLTRRGKDHRDFHLLHDLVQAIRNYLPEVFAIENVPAVRSHLDEEVQDLVDSGYSVEGRVVRYADWGAPSRRRRFFSIGVRNGSADSLWDALESLKADEQTVEDAIGRFRDLPRNGAPDHEWGEFRTISKYGDKYRTGQYGWYRLSWRGPAPSFGNVGKTYVLHPDEDRVISVREAIAILGFDDTFEFPDAIGRTAKYRMAADAVSPYFSRALAAAVQGHFDGTLVKPSEPAMQLMAFRGEGWPEIRSQSKAS